MRYTYERLSALDNSFLVLEKPNSYMHVASTQIFEAGPLRTEDGGIDATAIRKKVASVLHLIPRYRQRLAWIPLENHPVWIDDDRFNLDYHIRHTGLPRPGSEEQLKRLSSRIMQQHLDRTRPLWEIWVVEGLDGDRFALVSKVHHCMIDGVSGVDLMKVLMSATRDQPSAEAPVFVPRPVPSWLDLLRYELLRRVTLPFQIVRGARSLLLEAQDTRLEILVRLRSMFEALGGTFRLPSETPINQPIGPHRRFDWITMDLAELKELRKALGGTLNDIVLAVVCGAVRSFLKQRQVNPDAIDFRVMTPVSVRSENERGALGNRVSAWIVELPLDEEDPAKQLARIRERTSQLREVKQAIGADALTQAIEWTPSLLLALGARNMTRLLPFNLVVTNVPGPQIPMYMAGALMTETYPHVPLMDRLGLGVALMSYNGRLCWGFNADYDLLPDLREFVRAIEASYAALQRVATSRPRLVATQGRR